MAQTGTTIAEKYAIRLQEQRQASSVTGQPDTMEGGHNRHRRRPCAAGETLFKAAPPPRDGLERSSQIPGHAFTGMSPFKSCVAPFVANDDM